MEMTLFGIFAVTAVVAGISVIMQKNPVYSALSLLAQLLCLVLIYALLHAYLIMVIQLIVYAGAVIVLFLFAIMILNPEEEKGWMSSISTGKILAVCTATAGFLIMLIRLTMGQNASFSKEATELSDNIKAVGKLLFVDYVFPFEMISVLLLIAVIGVTYLAKKEDGNKPVDTSKVGPQ